MPLWASLYLLGVGAALVWSAVDDLRAGRPRWRPAADAAATVALAYLFAGYFRPDLVEPFGRLAAPLFVGALLWTGAAAHREVTEDEPDPELSPRSNLLAEHAGIAVGVLCFAPLLALAAAAAYAAWQRGGT